MRQAISSVLTGCVRLFYERAILVLTLMLCAGVAGMLWQVSRVQSNLVTSIAVQDASLYAQALAEFRTLYTSEVVETVRDHGIEVIHDYATKAGAIPLPVTLSILIGQRIGAHRSGAQTRLYSPYPFPWRRQEGGLQDAFAKEAWNALRQHPAQPFYRFEDVQGRRSLRYATADLMRPSCVNCHNTHPASPKTDWQTGEVRGILEVILPLDTAIAQTHAGLRGTLGLMMVMSALGLSGLALVIGRLRRSSADLERQAHALQSEITERRRAEEALQYRVSFEKLITTVSTHFMNLASHEIDSGIHSALQTIGEFAGVDRSYVLLFSDNGTKMDNTHEWCATGVASYIHQRQGLSVAAWPWFAEKVRQLEPIHILRVSDLPSAARAERVAFQLQGLQSLIIVPMVYGGSLMGCLGCEAVRAEKTWSEDSITLLKIIGEILVNALERKRTEEAIRRALTASEASRDELERFNRFAIGRELRMIELKKQVNALLTAWGEPAMYTIDAIEEEHT
jgi:hypothetical protein